MSKFELKLPQMGESVAEATLTTWLKEVGDTIEMDEAVFEIATDKVDSEVPSEVEGVLLEKRFEVDDVIKVGEVVAVIEIDGEAGGTLDAASPEEKTEEVEAAEPAIALESQMAQVKESVSSPAPVFSSSDRFYSPLVKNIAKEEGVSMEELESIVGTGKEGRVTKNDIKAFLENRSTNGGPKTEKAPATEPTKTVEAPPKEDKSIAEKPKSAPIQVGAGDEIIPLTRMGKLIAQHMVDSVATSAHVQSFVEVDVTNVVNWRNKVKKSFEEREGEKLTFTPILWKLWRWP